MQGKSLARLDPVGQIIVPLADLGRSVLQHAGNEADLLGGVNREISRGRTPEVVHTCVPAESQPETGSGYFVKTLGRQTAMAI